MFTWNSFCFSLCLLPLVHPLGTTKKSLALLSRQYLWARSCENWRVRASHLYFQRIQLMLKTVKNSGVLFLLPFSSLLGKAANPRVVSVPLSVSLYPHFLTWGLQRGAVILNISICHWGQCHFRSSGLTWFEPGPERRVWSQPGHRSVFGDGWRGLGRWRVLGFFWMLLPLGVRRTRGARPFTEWEPARLVGRGWEAGTDACSIPLLLAPSKHKRDGNNSL